MSLWTLFLDYVIFKAQKSMIIIIMKMIINCCLSYVIIEKRNLNWYIVIVFGLSSIGKLYLSLLSSLTKLMYFPEEFHTFMVTANGVGVCVRQRYISLYVWFNAALFCLTLDRYLVVTGELGGGGHTGCQRFITTHHHVFTYSDKQLHKCEHICLELCICLFLFCPNSISERLR